MEDVLISRIIYPNPFEPSGIEFKLKFAGIVTIANTDTAGNILVTPCERRRYEQGTHSSILTLPSGEPGGLFCTITAEIVGETVTDRKKLN